MTANHEPWREAIRRILSHRVEGAADASAIAEAIAAIWSQAADLLTPVIGNRGFEVIFRRSLYLTSKTFPWLAFDEEQGDVAALLASLKSRIAGRDADDAAEAGYTLLVAFTELLITLIGESLTDRMLGPVWAPQQRSSGQEIES